MNPRVSTVLASTSRPSLAKLVGYTLDEIKNDTKKTPASFEPTIDYVVTKIPGLHLKPAQTRC